MGADAVPSAAEASKGSATGGTVLPSADQSTQQVEEAGDLGALAGLAGSFSAQEEPVEMSEQPGTSHTGEETSLLVPSTSDVALQSDASAVPQQAQAEAHLGGHIQQAGREGAGDQADVHTARAGSDAVPVSTT